MVRASKAKGSHSNFSEAQGVALSILDLSDLFADADPDRTVGFFCLGDGQPVRLEHDLHRRIAESDMKREAVQSVWREREQYAAQSRYCWPIELRYGLLGSHLRNRR